MTENLSPLSIGAFKKAAVENPQVIFEQIRKHNIIEQAYLAILFSELETEWNNLKSIPITIQKISCLTELLLTKDYNIQLNLGSSEIFSEETVQKHLKQAFIFSSEKSHYIFNQETVIDASNINSAIYVFNQILMCFYREKLQGLYIRHLKSTGYKSGLDDMETLDWNPNFFPPTPITPRYGNSNKALTPRDHKKIFDRLKKAGFNIKEYQLPEFRQFYINETSNEVIASEGSPQKALDNKQPSGKCLTFCRIL